MIKNLSYLIAWWNVRESDAIFKNDTDKNSSTVAENIEIANKAWRKKWH
ncbi:hypothetical protein ANAPH2_01566 [Anaplasma phagocytophilum]|nr:hypothetical protein ANAPH2_01566 [Anaplasma phagocytophilum]